MRILYGVMSEGMGHAIRSSVVRDHLVSKGHEVTFACGNSPASKYLNKYGPVVRTPRFTAGTHNGRFNPIKAIQNLPNVATVAASPLLLAGLPRPDVVLTDFEPCTARYASFFGIGLVAIDNISFTFRCSHPASVIGDMKVAVPDVLVARGVVPGAFRYMIPSFVNAPVRFSNTTLHLPILRPNTFQACSVNHGAVVVYFNQLADWPKIIAALKACAPMKFQCYGSGQDAVDGNVTLLGMSDGLLSDLACAKAVIGGGGFTFMTECIYSRKPLLSMPFTHVFEQVLNSNYLQELGYGMRCDDLTPTSINEFLQRCPEFTKNLEPVCHDNNASFFDSLDRMLGC